MPDPFAATWRRPANPRPPGGEVLGRLDQLLGRLRELGATADEVEQFALRWADTDDPEWTDADRDLMVAMSDHSLRQLIAGVRTEWEGHRAGP